MGGDRFSGPTPYDLAVAGWAIIPVEPRGKRPLVMWGRYVAERPSPEQVARWEEEFPGCNWAVILGPVSGNLIGVDIDAPEGQAWCDAQGGFVRSPTAWHTTGRAWRYLYTVPEFVADLGVVTPHPDVEIRVSGCLCNIPPSIHENGTTYTWRVPPAPGGKTRWRRVGAGQVPEAIWPIPLAPQWLLDLLVASPGRKESKTSQPRSEPRSTPLTLLLARDLSLADHIMRVVHRAPVPIGKDFRCILPGHKERHPSASWWIADDGRVLYRDWHGRGGHEWYGLAEVWHAIENDEPPRHLNPYEAARALESLACDAGHLVPRTEELLRAAEDALQALGGDSKTTEKCICDYVVSAGFLPGAVFEVWRVLEELFRARARERHASALASARFVSRLAGTSLVTTNRACNLLCVLGVVRKVGSGERGDAYELCLVHKDEVRRRWYALGRPPLEKFNRELVGIRLGLEIAAGVFRRLPS